MRVIITTILFFTTIYLSAQRSNEVPYTLEDRDRLIRLEQKVESLEKQMNIRFEAMDTKFETKFESLQTQLNDLKKLMYFVLAGIITSIGFTIGLVGFILWDRRSIERKVIESEENNQKIFHIFKQQAKEDKKLAEILKLTGII